MEQSTSRSQWSLGRNRWLLFFGDTLDNKVFAAPAFVGRADGVFAFSGGLAHNSDFFEPISPFSRGNAHVW
ncbi:MAG TPA: hypothetical protein DDW52_27290 [Planctomycetaceae bacterium]|nr:hypothetical protein [Planctomycetaceae bacterium]